MRPDSRTGRRSTFLRLNVFFLLFAGGCVVVMGGTNTCDVETIILGVCVMLPVVPVAVQHQLELYVRYSMPYSCAIRHVAFFYAFYVFNASGAPRPDG